MNNNQTQTAIHRIITPHISGNELLPILRSSNPIEDVRQLASRRFYGVNMDFDRAKERIKADEKRLKRLVRVLNRAEARKARTPAVRTSRSGKVLRPLTKAAKIKIAVGLIAVVLDVPVLLYTAGEFVLASGTIASLADSLWGALPFTFVLATTIVGLKSWGEAQPTEDARDRFTTALLRIGAAAAVVFSICFAVVFNAGSIPEALDGQALATMAAPKAISWEVAATLLAGQIAATVCFGAGISLSVTSIADRNKALVSEPSEQYAAASKAVEELSTECAALESAVIEQRGFLSRFRPTHDAFVEQTAGRLADMRERIAARKRLSDAEITRSVISDDDNTRFAA